MIASITIQDGEYSTSGQKMLIELWEKNLKKLSKGFPDIGIIFTLPRNKRRTVRKRFEGFKVANLGFIAGDRELVRMETGDFILLMAKSGIKVSIEEVKQA